MSAIDELVEKEWHSMTKIQQAIFVAYQELIGYEGIAIDAAEQVAALEKVAEAAGQYLKETPESEIDLAREVWGNTNANCVILKRKNLASALAAYEAAKKG